MSLTGALATAQSALANSAIQSALLSKNIANVGNTDYSRRSAATITQAYGTVAQGDTQRATSKALLSAYLSAQSTSASTQAFGDGLTALAQTLGLDTSATGATSAADDTSPATLIGSLETALQRYAAQPDDQTLAGAAVSAATSLAANLNDAASAVQSVRAQADADMASSVKTINGLLAQFQTVNDTIVAGTATGRDVTDAQDARDGLLKQLSNEIGISAVRTTDGGTSIYTDSGVTLFETTPRTVAFSATATFASGTTGQAVSIDGIPVTGSSAVMPIASGKLAGLAKLRDVSSVAYANQLDQIASALISSFAETDQTGSGKPTLAGLFTAGGSTSLPGSVGGVAASLRVAARVDPTVGGVATRLRDGNVSSSDPAYTYNTTGAAAFSDRLQGMLGALDATRGFDGRSGGSTSASIAGYAASSVGWLSAQRQTATTQSNSASAVAAAATTALSNATGVNLDDEMSRMLDIEHAYQASAQLLNTVNTMYATLLQAFN